MQSMCRQITCLSEACDQPVMPGNRRGASRQAGSGAETKLQEDGMGFSWQCFTCTSLARGAAHDEPVTVPYCWVQGGQGEAVGGETEQMVWAGAPSRCC